MTQEIQDQKLTRNAVIKKALISSIPVMMGYTTMGFAAGVLLSAHTGVSFAPLWAFLSSATSISGTLQFMIVDWIRVQTSLLTVAILTVCINIRYGMYGISMLERFKPLNKLTKFYLIWTLTDETYALEESCPIKDPKKNILYCLCLAAFNHSYWVIGVTIGAFAGTALPFSNEGIDFSMTALFLVILTDQFQDKQNRLPVFVGLTAALIAFLVFGAAKMLIPAMILMITAFLVFRRKIEKKGSEA